MRTKRRVVERIEIDTKLTNQQRQAWNTLKPVVRKVLEHKGQAGVIRSHLKKIKEKSIERHGLAKKKLGWIGELLDMVGED